ncbi:MAG: transporter substrate-binding domain-containing protein [Clostridiaceae bacterium]
MKKFLATVLTIILTFSLVGCGSSKDKTASSDEAFTGSLEGALKGVTLKVGTSGTYAPFSYFDTDGKSLIGFDMEFMNALQKLLGFEIDGSVQAMDYSPLTTSVAEGKLDIAMAALCATDTRKKVMNFTETYYNAGLTVIVNKEKSPKEITGFDSIKSGKYKIAVQKGDASHLYLTGNGVPESSIEVHDTISTVLESLEQGKVDAMVYDAPGTAYYIANKKDSKLAMIGDQFAQDQSPYAIAVSFDAGKKNPKLLSILNAAVKKLKEDGTMAEIEKKWCK